MGAPMAGHLLAAGHEVHVFNRTRARADGLVADGAVWHDAPAAVAEAVEVVVTMVGYPADVRVTVDAVLPAMPAGALLVDMTTSEPTLAVEVAEAAAARGVDALDAPVSGGDVGARNATLVIMCGGTPTAFDRARPLLEVLGTPSLNGGPGAGQHTKMTNQIAIAGGMVGVCEALLYAYRAGLDLDATIATIGRGAAGSWSLANLAPRVAHGDLEPGLQDRPLRQGPRDRPRGGAPDGAAAARPRAGRGAVPGRPGPGPGPEGHAGAAAGAGPDGLGRLAGGEPA